MLSLAVFLPIVCGLLLLLLGRSVGHRMRQVLVETVTVVTSLLQVPMGFIAENPSAWAICETLVREAVAVAAGEGIEFDADEKVAEVRKVCTDSPAGLTSIYADLRDGRRTEVDTISGSVIRASERNGVPAPTHRAMVQLVHAMEQKHQA